MQFNKTKHFFFAGFLVLAVSTAFAQDNKLTVEELLRLDNAQAVQKAREEAAKASGISKNIGDVKVETIMTKPVNLPQQWSIRSIYGSGKSIAADIVAAGISHLGVSPGAKVNGCMVTAIQGQCLVTKSEKVLKKNQFDSCPGLVCWTGDELSAELQPNQTKGPEKASSVTTQMPQPMPLPAGVVQAK